MFIRNLPHKTVERLSQYRRSLLMTLSKEKTHVFSHEIAQMLHITPVQVRRDLMLIGYSGNLRKGYDIKELIDLIGKIIDSDRGQRVAVVGLGNLGKAMISYFKGKRSKLAIIAAFDINPEKINRIYDGVACYHVSQLTDIIRQNNISIGIISVPSEQAPEIAETMVLAGIKGILNFTPKPLNVPAFVYLEEYDMITSLEKVAFFAKKNDERFK
ncbi:MAG: redox-sensing transcriptional repressor Rex [Bacteroidales bacterium]|nr:redox-sensing transcriptional repressor Rex [Bacteroidales bacterium]HNW72806.1 redox-sensing transcriptional repressor Rex [Bacteroidales bacterium]HPS50696.1 redox-sensing transcriptional repressor Rex [Bacteroidales bacterium]